MTEEADIRVLLVEDEAHIAAGLKLNLELEGYLVDVARTGREAGEFLLSAQNYGVIILDVMLPDTDGFTICRRLRGAGIYVPVIMLTAIYCACKVEENYISAEEFCKGMGQDTDASRVLNAELTLLAGLRFQLVTYSPYRALDGFRRDLEAEAAKDAEVATRSEQLDACAAAGRSRV